jgi:membrane-bound metal-dependent hydrolase YbcI (DUF457 family)
MGKSHAVCGLISGVALSALVPSAPLPIKGLVVVTAGGAALLPDLDHPQATAARSLGFATKAIATAVDQLSLSVYYATAAPGDHPERKSGHRLLTHTVPASLLAGGLVAVLGLVSPIAVSLCVALLAGLLAQGIKVAGGGLFVVTFGVSLWVFSQETGWSWLVSLAVTVGCLIHIWGDWCTNSGVPVLWPLVSQGKRWRLVHAPVTFAAGDSVETALVRPLLYGGLLLTVAWETGLAGVVFEAWMKART